MTTPNFRRLALPLAFLVVPALSACRGNDAQVDTNPTTETATPAPEVGGDALRVTDVDLGRSIGPDNRVNDNDDTDDFRPRDTIYASVATEGSRAGTLTARWTFEDGQVVDETRQSLSPTGPSVTEFHISKPDGFPVGNYKVEILLDNQVVDSKDFEVIAN